MSPAPRRRARGSRASSAAILLALAMALAPGAARALARSSEADEAIRLGDVLARRGLFEVAIQQLERAEQLAGGRSAKLDVAFARAYAGAGQRDKALAAANAALAAGAAGLVAKEAHILRCENRPPAAAGAAAPLDVRPPVVAPEAIWKDDVVYPLGLARKWVHGIVAVAFVVDEEGCVSDARFTQRSGTRLDQITLDTVKRWIFRPATLEGKPVKVRDTATWDFKVRIERDASLSSSVAARAPVGLALAAHPSGADEVLRLGDLLARQGLFAQAIEQLLRADQLAGGRSAKVDVALARAFAGAGQRDKALVAANAALANGAAGLVEKEAHILRCENRPPAPAGAAAPLDRRTPGTTGPVAISNDGPDYPRGLSRKRAQGTVAVEFVVDEQGCVSDARVTRGTGTGLDQATLAAVERWVYRPATLKGRPVRVRNAMTSKFEIKAVLPPGAPGPI